MFGYSVAGKKQPKVEVGERDLESSPHGECSLTASPKRQKPRLVFFPSHLPKKFNLTYLRSKKASTRRVIFAVAALATLGTIAAL